MIVHVVTACRECALVDDDEQPWLCTMPLFLGELEPRVIGEIGATCPPPPAWCPLRQADFALHLASDVPTGRVVVRRLERKRLGVGATLKRS